MSTRRAFYGSKFSWAASAFLICACAADDSSSASGDRATRGPARTDARPSSGTAGSPQLTNPAGSSAFGSGPALAPTPSAATPSPAQPPGAPACASAELNVTRVVPTVWLMVDGSGSMRAPLDALLGPSRWTLLRDVLTNADTGLVPRLQGSVSFGFYVYDGGLSLPGVPGPQCPRTVVVPTALNNAAAITGAYPIAETGASTPTHYGLVDLKRRIDAAGPNPMGPTYVVLATDGKPNLCDFHDGIPATPATEREAVDTVSQLAAAGTKVFVISMAGNDADLRAHLEEVAAAGQTGTKPFAPASQAELANALTQIIGATASCDVRIQGRVEPGRECTGTVSMNGAPLVCNDPNGYRLKDDRQSLELLGEACKTLQTSSSPALKATFPCQDVVLL